VDVSSIATGIFRVLETGDVDLARKVVSEANSNREATVSPAPCQIPGPAGTLASSAWMRAAFSDLRFPILGIAESADQVWVRLRMQGTHTGPFVRYRDGKLYQAIPPTGHEIDFESIHILDLANGQVVGHQAVRDDFTMLRQLGVYPPTLASAARKLSVRMSGRAARYAAEVTALAAAAADQIQS